MVDDREEKLVSLMREVAAGNRSAFRKLYARTDAKRHAAVRRVLPSDAIVEDAVQEVFVRISRPAGDHDAGIASPIARMTPFD